MQKAIKSLLLLAVLAAVAIGAAVYLKKSGGSGASANSAQSADAKQQPKKGDPPMRVEEKYGFTTETVAP